MFFVSEKKKDFVIFCNFFNEQNISDYEEEFEIISLTFASVTSEDF